MDLLCAKRGCEYPATTSMIYIRMLEGTDQGLERLTSVQTDSNSSVSSNKSSSINSNRGHTHFANYGSPPQGKSQDYQRPAHCYVEIEPGYAYPARRPPALLRQVYATQTDRTRSVLSAEPLITCREKGGGNCVQSRTAVKKEHRKKLSLR